MGQDPIFRLNNIGQIAAPAIGFLKNHWHDSQHVRSSENVFMNVTALHVNDTVLTI
jgi:hypothetical protein